MPLGEQVTDDQKKAIDVLPFEKKVQFLFGQFASLSRDMGLDLTVVYVADKGMHAAARWPVCNEGCTAPESCTADIFRGAASDLMVQAQKIDNGTADFREESYGGHDA